MEAKWLEDFLSVARTGNFSQSASERHVSQPAFSRRIKALEQWVGVCLIDRSSYPTRLTVAGEAFREAAREATVSLLKTREQLRQALNADRRLLRIAVQHSLAGTFLANWLARLPLPAADDLLVRARADNLHDCVRDLEEGNVDLLICYTHPDLPLHLDSARYPSLWLARDALVAVARPGPDGRPLHALKAGAATPVPWLAYSEEAFLGRAAALAMGGAPAALALHAVFESALAEALRAAALVGLGVAWLPGELVAGDLQGGTLVRAGTPAFDVPLRICAYADRALHGGHLAGLWSAAQGLALRS